MFWACKATWAFFFRGATWKTRNSIPLNLISVDLHVNWTWLDTKCLISVHAELQTSDVFHFDKEKQMWHKSPVLHDELAKNIVSDLWTYSRRAVSSIPLTVKVKTEYIKWYIKYALNHALKICSGNFLCICTACSLSHLGSPTLHLCVCDEALQHVQFYPQRLCAFIHLAHLLKAFAHR